MTRWIALAASQAGPMHSIIVAEALRAAAEAHGQQLSVAVADADGRHGGWPADALAQAQGCVVATDFPVDLGLDTGVWPERLIHRTTPQAVLADAKAAWAAATAALSVPTTPANAAPATAGASRPLHIVAITSCPTGVAHTFMAAEALLQGSRALGHVIQVETQGSVGAQNRLSEADIARADLVIIAADTQVARDRFVGKRLHAASTKAAIHDAVGLIRAAAAEAQPWASPVASGEPSAGTVRSASGGRSGPYKHLMTGVSFMLPFVVAGGLLIALAFALGGIYVYDDAHKGSLGWVLFQVGAKAGFALMLPALGGYIAYSIADRPGIAPGMIGGMLAGTVGAGFLGAIAGGFIAGYGVHWLNRQIRLPRGLEGLKPVLILPLLGSALVGVLMLMVVGEPMAAVMAALTTWLKGLQTGSAVLLGLVLGAMMAFDMGGPVNKAAYVFSTTLIATGVTQPMAAAMAAGMTPPLGIALACWVFRSRFSDEEREASKAAAVLGLAFITEGAIPFVARDPLRVIPGCMLGSATAGALSMAWGIGLQAPHGGIFVLAIPNAVNQVLWYALAILVGSAVTGLALGLLKRPVAPAAA